MSELAALKAVNESSKPVVLVGLSGSGKTTVAAALERTRNWSWIDIDRSIEANERRSITEIIRVEGEPRFRDLEAEALEQALKRNPDVISTGGGALMRERNLDLALANGLLVWLDASSSLLADRVIDEERERRRAGASGAGQVIRPLLTFEETGSLEGQTENAPPAQVVARLEELRAKRCAGYERATLRVLTDLLTVEEVAAIIATFHGSGVLEQLTGRTSRARSAGARPVDGTCGVTVLGDGLRPRGTTGLIIVTAGMLEPVVTSIAKDVAPRRSAIALIEDGGAREPWGTAVAAGLSRSGAAEGPDAKRSLQIHRIEVAPGEKSKAFQNVELISETLLAKGIARNDLIVAVGGGVVGDLGGLVASLFMRGVPLVHVPTTLVAQVDSAIGGKTAVNLPSAKNAIGTFYPAGAVISDVTTLRTLPEREYRSGMAEVVKYGLLFEPDLLDRIERDLERIERRESDVLMEIVVRCSAMKASVVSRDLEDTRGIRAFLNLGHTVGHAIESLAGYGTFLHGEAVAIGLQCALWLSCGQLRSQSDERPAQPDAKEQRLTETYRKTVHLLERLQLPIKVPPALMDGAAEWMVTRGARASSKISSVERRRKGAETPAVEKGAPVGDDADSLNERAASFENRWSSTVMKDKKRSSADSIAFVLLEEPGAPYLRKLTLPEILVGVATSPFNDVGRRVGD